MPVQDEPQGPASEHVLEEAAIGRTAEFVDELPPGLRQRQIGPKLQGQTIVRRLAVLALLAEALVEQLRLRQRLRQPRKAIGRQKTFGIQPGIGRLPLKGGGIEAVHHGFVDVFHRCHLVGGATVTMWSGRGNAKSRAASLWQSGAHLAAAPWAFYLP